MRYDVTQIWHPWFTGHGEPTGKFWKRENKKFFTVLSSEYPYSASKLKTYTQIKILAAPPTDPLISSTHLPLTSSSTTHTHLSGCLHRENKIIPCNDFLGAIQFCIIPPQQGCGKMVHSSPTVTHCRHTAAVRSARADACTSKDSTILKAYICIYLYSFFREIKIKYFLHSYKNDEFS